VPTVVIHPVPWLATMNDQCAVLLVLRSGCSASVARRRADAERRDAVEVERAAVAAAGPPARAVDFADAFCSATRCSSVRRGEIVYGDRDHLSPQGALLLEGRFARLVRSAAVARR
jgi:hypothetical protein